MGAGWLGPTWPQGLLPDSRGPGPRVCPARGLLAACGAVPAPAAPGSGKTGLAPAGTPTVQAGRWGRAASRLYPRHGVATAKRGLALPH